MKYKLTLGILKRPAISKGLPASDDQAEDLVQVLIYQGLSVEQNNYLLRVFIFSSTQQSATCKINFLQETLFQVTCAYM